MKYKSICKHCGKEVVDTSLPHRDRRLKSKSCQHISYIERFWLYTDKKSANECWNWIGTIINNGYGQFRYSTKERMSAHRYSYILHFGHIPDGMFICHKCDNPACVNPSHLFLGTHQDNETDKLTKCRNFHKLTYEQAREIKFGNASSKELSARFNIGTRNINHIRSGYTWKHIVHGGSTKAGHVGETPIPFAM